MRTLLMLLITSAVLNLWVGDLQAQANAGRLLDKGVYFSIRYERAEGDTEGDTESGVYTVSMRPTFTPGAPAMTLASQVTLKVPHRLGEQRFEVVDVQSLVEGTRWSARSRVDSPPESPATDYISFEVAFPGGNFAAINWQAHQEIELFRFKNSGACAGAVGLIENDDPFLAPNSASTNPGNQIDILGGPTGNLFRGVYDASVADCSAFDTTTSVAISNRRVTATTEGVRLCWQTETESTIAGFYLYKQSIGSGPEITKITEGLIVAHNSGQSTGAGYCYTDYFRAGESDTDKNNTGPVYWLEVLALDGIRTLLRLGSPNDQRIYLPTIRSAF